MFARYEAPRLARLIAQTRSANPNVKILYHSDGNLEAVIALLIDCGVDILNPVQSACMDPAEIKRKYGQQLVFHGTISVQDTVPRGSVVEVREEVDQRIRTVGYDGALVVSPENSIPFDAPLENILAIYETVREFDYRSIKAP
jgi:uroporphyrinogen-III decarboxylase